MEIDWSCQKQENVHSAVTISQRVQAWCTLKTMVPFFGLIQANARKALCNFTGMLANWNGPLTSVKKKKAKPKPKSASCTIKPILYFFSFQVNMFLETLFGIAVFVDFLFFFSCCGEKLLSTTTTKALSCAVHFKNGWCLRLLSGCAMCHKQF